MKNSYKVALLAALGLVTATAAHAQYNSGDLLVGFESSAGDYVVDVGQISGLTLNDNLSSQFTAADITALLSGTSPTVGAVGGDNFNDIVWKSVTRTTQPVTSSGVRGSSIPSNANDGGIDDASGMPGNVQQGSTALSLQPGNTSWGDTITGRAGSLVDTFHADVAFNPSALVAGAVNLDIYTATDNGNTVEPYSYVGDLEISASGTGVGSTDTVIWDPTVSAVPEPSTYGLLAGFGLLAVALRNQFSRKNA